MLRIILSYGLLAGLVVGIPMFVLGITMQGSPPPSWGMLFGYTTMLIALATVFIAVKRRRDHALGGVIGFWPAFALGLGISFVASVVYVLAWEAVVAMTQMDFADEYAKMLIDERKAEGVSGEALAKFTAEMDAFRKDYANPLFRLPMTFSEIFPVGLLVSLVSAGLLCNRRFLALKRA